MRAIILPRRRLIRALELTKVRAAAGFVGRRRPHQHAAELPGALLEDAPKETVIGTQMLPRREPSPEHSCAAEPKRSMSPTSTTAQKALAQCDQVVVDHLLEINSQPSVSPTPCSGMLREKARREPPTVRGERTEWRPGGGRHPHPMRVHP